MIKYTVQDGTIFEIGSGFDTQGAAESPEIINPFPNYTIGREFLTTGDGTFLGNKYSITVTGRILVSAISDITVVGDKQNNLQKQLIWHLKIKKPAYTQDHNIGRLEIEPYGGLANKIIFADARITGVDFPEQSDESSGVLYADYSITFEAYKEISVDATSGESICNKVSSFEESWEVTENENAGSMISIVANSIIYKTYTLTHTLSATGIKSLENNSTEVRLAWKNAADYVKARLKTFSSLTLSSDSANNTDKISKTFDPKTMGYTAEDAGVFTPNLNNDGYKFCGHMRVPKCDFSAGSYSVTETWTVTNMPHAATLDMNIESSVDENGTITMSLSGSINGLYSEGILNTNSVTEKLNNAEAVLGLLDAKAYFIAKEYYARPEYSLYETKGDTDLNKTVRTKTIGRNKLTGVITFSYTYNDSKTIIPNALSNTLSVNYDNEGEDVNIFAIIPIISKNGGPIFQDMNTTKEKRRTLNLGAIMKKDYRIAKPDLVSIINNYKPTASNVKVQSWTESWEPFTGNYSVNVEWVFK
jgi:hypothetical protein